jgi:raffinose/stachyose/melibiose transport system substrate-binding protein
MREAQPAMTSSDRTFITERRSPLRRWRLMAVVGLTFGMALVTGLSSASARVDQESVTLRMTVNSVYQAAMPVLIKNFNKAYPNINIEMSYAESGPITQILTTQLQAGNAPDIFAVQLGKGNAVGTHILAEAGRLRDLSKSPWVKRMQPSTRALLSWRGKVYASSFQNNVHGLVYNAGLLRQLGMSLPKNVSQLLSLCGRINAAGKIPFGQNIDGGGSIVMGTALYGQTVYSFDPTWDAKRARNQVQFATSPLWRRFLQTILNMNNSKCFQTGAQATTRDQALGLLTAGRSVFMFIASSYLPAIRAAAPNLNLQWINFPSGKNVVVTNPQNIAINAATRYPQQAETFVNFLAREGQSRLLARIAGGFSVADLNTANPKGIPASMSALVPLLKAKKVISNQYAGWPNPLVAAQGMFPGIQGLITGQTTVDSVLQSMDRFWAQGG